MYVLYYNVLYYVPCPQQQEFQRQQQEALKRLQQQQAMQNIQVHSFLDSSSSFLVAVFGAFCFRSSFVHGFICFPKQLSLFLCSVSLPVA
jgi:hypothetical protein